MSERMYTGRRIESGRPTPLRFIPWFVFAIAIGLMIAWVLLTGDDRHPFTIAIVGTTALAVFIWSFRNNGPIWTVTSLFVVMIYTYLLELIGVNTGIPFGEYEYTDSLGFQLADVPIVVPLAWYSMAIPTLILARSITKRGLLVVIFGMIGLTAWDFLLDPWMVAEGHWIWNTPEPTLPGLTGIPITNFIGWLISTFLLFLILDRLPKRRNVSVALPLTIYSWQWLGGTISNLFFLGKPVVALYVFGAMALLAIPAIFTQYVRHR
jgi:uncharacterized membrane protein